MNTKTLLKIVAKLESIQDYEPEKENEFWDLLANKLPEDEIEMIEQYMLRKSLNGYQVRYFN